MSGSQVSNPFAMANPGGISAQGTPYMQAGQLNQQNQIDLYNLAAQQASNTNQGLFGLGTMGLLAAI